MRRRASVPRGEAADGGAAPRRPRLWRAPVTPGQDGAAAPRRPRLWRAPVTPGQDGAAAPRRSRRRRALRALAALMIVSGTLALADAAATLVWQEPISAVYARVQQERLGGELAALERAAPAARVPDRRRRLALAAHALARRSEPGDPVGRLRVPPIGLNTIVVEGTGGAELRSGPGHYPGTPLPGRRGTVAIAGHRTTYGAPFRRIDELGPGDAIELAMPYGRFTYRVERTRIVAPDAVDVVDRVAYDRLVLTACHPLYSASRRIVVFAQLSGFR
jgi:sortase A